MNLLCPNCQKPLSVPEQYAGQPMRCPLCNGTFTVPGLPAASAPPPPAPLPPTPASPPSNPADVYGLKDAGAAPPPPPPPPMDLDLPPVSFHGAPPMSPPSAPPAAYVEEQPTYPVAPPPEGYQRKSTIWFSPKVLQYVAPVALFLVFVLTFFPWVGVYPGGVASAWQNGWQAIYGGWSYDSDVIVKHPPFAKGYEPGVNVLLIFFLLLLLPTLVVAFGCLALSFAPSLRLPPAVHPILPWRWMAVAALSLILLLFLGLQLVLGFSLANNYIAAEDNAVAVMAQARQTNTTPEVRDDAILRGQARQDVSRTIWLDLVVLLLILAVLGAALMFWVQRRGGRPAARIDMLW